MEGAAQAMTATAEKTSRQATAVSAASSQALANVQTVAAATEELSASIGEIGQQATRSSQITTKATNKAQRTDITANGLARFAEKIGEVVKLIQQIASQTNLLALNATIEAARAGEHGKGFAVVASEVKALANQTGKATEEIAAQIQSIQGATQEVVTAIRAIGTTIGEVSEIASVIAAAVEEQGAATHEMPAAFSRRLMAPRRSTATSPALPKPRAKSGSRQLRCSVRRSNSPNTPSDFDWKLEFPRHRAGGGVGNRVRSWVMGGYDTMCLRLWYLQGALRRFIGCCGFGFVALKIVANPSHNDGRRTGVLANHTWIASN